jgi:hypothetical protein
MTGFAEGFANGYGLIDTTMKNRDERNLKQAALDAEEAHYKDTKAQDEKIYNRDAVYHKEGLDKITRDEVLAADAVKKSDKQQIFANENTKKVTDSTISHQASVDASNKIQSIAAANASNASAGVSNFALQSAQIKKKADDSAQYIQNNFTTTDANNVMSIVAPKNDKEATTLLGHLHNLGIDASSMAGNSEHFSNAINTMQHVAMDNSLIDTHNPQVMEAANTVFGNAINQRGKQTLADGRVIENRTIKSILVHPSPDGNPANDQFTIDLNITGKDKNGKAFTYDSPMTQHRQPAEEDPTKRVFTRDQMAKMVIGSNQAFNIINSNPDLKSRLTAAVKNNLPAKEKGDYDVVYEYVMSPDGLTLVKKATGLVNKKDGKTYAYNNPADQSVTSEQAQWTGTTKPTTQQQQQGNSQNVNNLINSNQSTPTGLSSTKPEIKIDPVVQQARAIVNILSNKIDPTPQEIAALADAKNVIRGSTRNRIN